MANNEFLKELENQSVTADVISNIEHYSKIIPHIKRYEIDGDKVKVVGLNSNAPKDYKWAYNKDDFAASEVEKFTAEITNDDKKIFYCVFSHDIEALAINKPLLAKTLAKQADQVGYDAAVYLDAEIINNYVCEPNNYSDTARFEIPNHQNIKTNEHLKEIADKILTTALKMTAVTDEYNKKGKKVKARDTKRFLLFLDNGLYSKFRIGLTGVNTSISFEEFKKDYAEVINENLVNDVAWALVDKDSLAIAVALKKRVLVYDGYVDANKILDHIWRIPFFVDYRPAAIAFYKPSISSSVSSTSTKSTKDKNKE